MNESYRVRRNWREGAYSWAAAGACTQSTMVLAVLVVCVSVSLAAGQDKPVVTKTNVPVRRIEITPATTQIQTTVGSGLGILADIQNKSDVPVFLHRKYFTMTPAIELDPCGTLDDWWALIPGGPAEADKPIEEKVVLLAPGSKTTAFWGLPQKSMECKPGFLAALGRMIAFSPGEYTIRIVGMYWIDRNSVGKVENYFTETAEIKVRVGSPQVIILLGAAIGGLIAAFLFTTKWWASTRLLTAPLLAATVTILLSRVSEAPLPIRISINDFWGLIAVGFIAGAWGPNLLRKLIPGPNIADGTGDEAGKKPGRVAEIRQPVEPGGSTPPPNTA